MRPIEQKPIPMRARGLAGDLRRLQQPTDSFLIEDKGLKRAVLYSTASRLGISLITAKESGGLRVWRNFDKDAQPVTPRELIARPQTLVESAPIDGWDGWSEERTTRDDERGEVITYREHLKTRKRREIKRESSW